MHDGANFVSVNESAARPTAFDGSRDLSCAKGAANFSLSNAQYYFLYACIRIRRYAVEPG